LDKRITAEVVAVKSQVPRGSKAIPPRLRFDRVVLEVFERLRSALHEELPAGVTVVVTITAPIRLASKTTAAVEELVRAQVAEKLARGQVKKTILGNEVRIRIIRGRKTSSLMGFVHNRDSDPTILFDLTRALLECADSVGHGRRGTSARRWLVVAMEDEAQWMETYRHVCAQLFAPPDFQRVILVAANE